LVYSSATTLTCRSQYGGTIYTPSNFNSQNADYSNNIGGDPLLQVDYKISDLSPAVNAGTTALATVDYFGNIIPFPGTVPDIGIHETDVVPEVVELVTNGTFDTDTDWIKEGGGSSSWVIAGGVADLHFVCRLDANTRHWCC